MEPIFGLLGTDVVLGKIVLINDIETSFEMHSFTVEFENLSAPVSFFHRNKSLLTTERNRLKLAVREYINAQAAGTQRVMGERACAFK